MSAGQQCDRLERIAGAEYALGVLLNDGINASGGDSSDVSGDNPDPFSVEADAYIYIAGGMVNVDAGGDGLYQYRAVSFQGLSADAACRWLA